MSFKMYLLNIHGLEEEALQKTALAQMDSCRKALAQKYKQEKDRLRAIAAGLLLQMGFLELEPSEEFCKKEVLENGQCYIFSAKKCTDYLEKIGEEILLPIEISYKKGTHGKPYWDTILTGKQYSFKKMQYFNLSHSGDYAVLVIADTEVGVDIQEPRKTKHIEGGYQAFCRMEAYVKCTGEGFAGGIAAYKESHGEVPGYTFYKIEILEEYAMYLCSKIL